MYIFSLKCRENVLFELRSERVKLHLRATVKKRALDDHMRLDVKSVTHSDKIAKLQTNNSRSKALPKNTS